MLFLEPLSPAGADSNGAFPAKGNVQPGLFPTNSRPLIPKTLQLRRWGQEEGRGQGRKRMRVPFSPGYIHIHAFLKRVLLNKIKRVSDKFDRLSGRYSAWQATRHAVYEN